LHVRKRVFQTTRRRSGKFYGYNFSRYGGKMQGQIPRYNLAPHVVCGCLRDHGRICEVYGRSTDKLYRCGMTAYDYVFHCASWRVMGLGVIPKMG
jgi:hypothetical protein